MKCPWFSPEHLAVSYHVFLVSNKPLQQREMRQRGTEQTALLEGVRVFKAAFHSWMFASPKSNTTLTLLCLKPNHHPTQTHPCTPWDYEDTFCEVLYSLNAKNCISKVNECLSNSQKKCCVFAMYSYLNLYCFVYSWGKCNKGKCYRDKYFWMCFLPSVWNHLVTISSSFSALSGFEYSVPSSSRWPC